MRHVFLAIAIAILGVGVYLIFAPQRRAEAPVGEASLTPIFAPTKLESAQLENGPTGEIKEKQNGMHRITIETTKGIIQFETFDADAPKAAENFITLAKKGFYNGLTFHRIIKGFMIQGGDPKGDGTGGPGYTFADELNQATESYQRGYKKGVVAMANAGPDTNGSQFFIMLEDTPLPHKYTIFGRVVSGQEVVDAIGSIPTNAADRPSTPVGMTRVSVSDK